MEKPYISWTPRLLKGGTLRSCVWRVSVCVVTLSCWFAAVESPAVAATVITGDLRLRIMHAYNRSHAVQLTFDDCGSPRQFRRIVDALNRSRVRGTFYLTGQCVRSHPSYVDTIRQHGHILQNHTYSHTDLCRLSSRQVARQIRLGPRPTVQRKLVRPPFGACAFSPRIYRIAASLDYRVAYWTVDTADWTGISAKAMAHRVQVRRPSRAAANSRRRPRWCHPHARPRPQHGRSCATDHHSCEGTQTRTRLAGSTTAAAHDFAASSSAAGHHPAALGGQHPARVGRAYALRD